jgi:hypothetical protein
VTNAEEDAAERDGLRARNYELRRENDLLRRDNIDLHEQLAEERARSSQLAASSEESLT